MENEDPELAADIANRIAELYVKRNLYHISKGEIMNLLKNEYLKLTAKHNEFSKQYLPKHPKMIRLKQEMDQIVSRINEVKRSSFSFDDMEKGILGESKYALEGLKANNVSIQDRAETPLVPVKPKLIVNIILGMIVGLLGGVSLVFFFEFLDDTIKDPADLKKIVRWNFLGNVPYIRKRIGRSKEIEKDLWVHLHQKTRRQKRTGRYVQASSFRLPRAKV